VLQGLDFHVQAGEFVCISGPSGSGKSTLLHLLGCLLTPSAGSYRLAGNETAHLGDGKRARIRADDIGFVFQTFHLIPTLDVYGNVALAFLYGADGGRDVSGRVQRVIDQVGLSRRMRHRPAALSGGEMQRVAIARALVKEPVVLLADEPTGNLDSLTGARILDLFARFHRHGTTVIMVSHDADVACRATRVLHLKDGRFVDPETGGQRKRRS